MFGGNGKDELFSLSAKAFSRSRMPQNFGTVTQAHTALAIDALLQPCQTTKRLQNRLTRSERVNVAGINSKLLHIHPKCHQLRGHARSC